EIPPAEVDVDLALQTTDRYWKRWSGNYVSQGNYDEEVQRSLLVLRAQTHERTGGIVAAPTTSLPEQFGGQRNWDYRYCWLRDAALTLCSLIEARHRGEALLWVVWVL